LSTGSYFIIKDHNVLLKNLLDKHKTTKLVIEKLQQLHPLTSPKIIKSFVTQMGGSNQKKEDWSHQILFDLNAKISTFKITPLMVAILFRNEEACQLLLEAGANPNESDIHNWTAIHHAAALNNRDICSLLLNHKADPNLKTNLNGTALDLLHMVNAYFPENLPITLYEFGEHQSLTNKSFKELTGAAYTPNIIITTDLLYKKCYLAQERPEFKNTLLEKTILENYENNKEGFALYMEKCIFGFGVKSKENIPKYTIICEYTGSIIPNVSIEKNKNYILDDIQSEKTRNIGPMINDSFPNAGYINLTINGYTRLYVVSFVKIEANTFIHVCYDTLFMKNKTHVEYNYEKVIFFLQNTPIKSFIEKRENKDSNSLNDLEFYTQYIQMQ
jgi:hypothetical protein